MRDVGRQAASPRAGQDTPRARTLSVPVFSEVASRGTAKTTRLAPSSGRCAATRARSGRAKSGASTTRASTQIKTRSRGAVTVSSQTIRPWPTRAGQLSWTAKRSGSWASAWAPPQVDARAPMTTLHDTRRRALAQKPLRHGRAPAATTDARLTAGIVARLRGGSNQGKDNTGSNSRCSPCQRSSEVCGSPSASYSTRA